MKSRKCTNALEGLEGLRFAISTFLTMTSQTIAIKFICQVLSRHNLKRGTASDTSVHIVALDRFLILLGMEKVSANFADLGVKPKAIQ